MQPLVSIITPAYNSAKYILDTIYSVTKQTYSNWEMLIIVDEACSDDTYARATSVNDPRIVVINKGKNARQAGARNIALQQVSGRFVAYLDADDIWLPEKLEKQVAFMLEGKIGFSCVSYEVIDDAGKSLEKKVYMKNKFDYKGFLLNNLIQTVGVMVDLKIVKKTCLVMPELSGGEDMATWLQILKSGICCYGIPQVLAQYRRTIDSASSNKFKAIKRTWTVYRKVEKLPLYFACYCFIKYALLAVWKRVYWTSGKIN
jgi:teichuronic acid biosynthesis glycosyltransferase TuaG